jgi:hypothetical protein
MSPDTPEFVFNYNQDTETITPTVGVNYILPMASPKILTFNSVINALSQNYSTATAQQPAPFMFAPPTPTIPVTSCMSPSIFNQSNSAMTYSEYLQCVANMMPIQQNHFNDNQNFAETPIKSSPRPTTWELQAPSIVERPKPIHPYAKQNTVRNVHSIIKSKLSEYDLLNEALVTERNVQYFHCNRIESLALLPEIVSDICEHKTHYGIEKMNIRQTKRNSNSLKGVMVLCRMKNQNSLQFLFKDYPEFKNLKWKKISGMKQNY